MPNRLDRNAENISEALIEHLDDWADKGYNVDIDRLKPTLRGAKAQGVRRPVSWTAWSPHLLGDAAPQDPQERLRQLLLSFKDDPTYKNALGAIEVPELRQKVETYVNEGKITDEWPDLDQYPPPATLTRAEDEKLVIWEDEKKTRKMDVRALVHPPTLSGS